MLVVFQGQQGRAVRSSICRFLAKEKAPKRLVRLIQRAQYCLERMLLILLGRLNCRLAEIWVQYGCIFHLNRLNQKLNQHRAHKLLIFSQLVKLILHRQEEIALLVPLANCQIHYRYLRVVYHGP